jgi:hypothetical protein
MLRSQEATKVNEEGPLGQKIRLTVLYPQGETVQADVVFVGVCFFVTFVCFCKTQLPIWV